MALSCTVSEIRRLIGWKLHIFHTPVSFGAPLPIFPLEFHGEIKRQETRVMGLLCGEVCIILTSIVFDWSTHVTDRRTDGRTDGRVMAYRPPQPAVVAVAECLHWLLQVSAGIRSGSSRWKFVSVATEQWLLSWTSHTGNYNTKSFVVTAAGKRK